MNELKWNVYYHDANKQEIVQRDIFDNSYTKEQVFNFLKESSTKEEFAKKLKSFLMYHYWSRSEYEILIGPWCGGYDTKEIKVDIYSQIMMNWEVFLNYVWSFSQKEEEDMIIEVLQERPKGRWIETGYFANCSNPIYECSNCRREVADYRIDAHKFCLHCGADMRESERE